MENTPLVGQPTTPDELDWIALWREMRRTSPSVLNDAAKQMATVSGAISTLYVSLLTGLKISDSFPALDAWGKFFLLAPVGAWIVATVLSICSLLPLPYSAYPDSAESIESACGRMNRRKFRFLAASTLALVVGVALAAYSAVYEIS
jgi:hypothetical protein